MIFSLWKVFLFWRGNILWCLSNFTVIFHKSHVEEFFWESQMSQRWWILCENVTLLLLNPSWRVPSVNFPFVFKCIQCKNEKNSLWRQRVEQKTPCSFFQIHYNRFMCIYRISELIFLLFFFMMNWTMKENSIKICFLFVLNFHRSEWRN